VTGGKRKDKKAFKHITNNHPLVVSLLALHTLASLPAEAADLRELLLPPLWDESDMFIMPAKNVKWDSVSVLLINSFL